MPTFLAAIQFLTFIPVKVNAVNRKVLAGSIFYFPLVGVLLGLILVFLNNLLLLLGAQDIFINTILTVFLIVLTGGMHLDGLADTADALLSSKSKQETLNIMRDPHIGAMGVLGLISIVLIKISLLSSVSAEFKPMALVLMCMLSRWAMVETIFLFPYAREDGKAKVFIEGINRTIFIYSLILSIILVLVISGITGLLNMSIVSLFVLAIGRYWSRKIGGITGDIIGSVNELSEVLVLFNIIMIVRFLHG